MQTAVIIALLAAVVAGDDDSTNGHVSTQGTHLTYHQPSYYQPQPRYYQPGHYQPRYYQPRYYQRRFYQPQPRYYQPVNYQQRYYQPQSRYYQPSFYQPRYLNNYRGFNQGFYPRYSGGYSAVSVAVPRAVSTVRAAGTPVRVLRRPAVVPSLTPAGRYRPYYQRAVHYGHHPVSFRGGLIGGLGSYGGLGNQYYGNTGGIYHGVFGLQSGVGLGSIGVIDDDDDDIFD